MSSSSNAPSNSNLESSDTLLSELSVQSASDPPHLAESTLSSTVSFASTSPSPPSSHGSLSPREQKAPGRVNYFGHPVVMCESPGHSNFSGSTSGDDGSSPSNLNTHRKRSTTSRGHEGDDEGHDTDSTLDDPFGYQPDHGNTSYFEGHPLQRMPRVGSCDPRRSSDDEVQGGHGHDIRVLIRSLDHDQQAEGRMNDAPTVDSSKCSSRSEWGGENLFDDKGGVASLGWDLMDYERIINNLVDKHSSLFELAGDRNLIMYPCTPLAPPEVPTSRSRRLPPLSASTTLFMIKCLPRVSVELLLLLELNHPEFREDPWNPAPHILGAIERDVTGIVDRDGNGGIREADKTDEGREGDKEDTGDEVFLFLEKLREYNDPPLENVAQYIDLFRQLLEGLTFLHEQRIAGLSCSNPSSFMVDLSSLPSTVPSPAVSPFPHQRSHQRTRVGNAEKPDVYLASAVPSPDHDQPRPQSQARLPHPGIPIITTRFDRNKYPVRYYFVNFSNASRVNTGKRKRWPVSMPGTPVVVDADKGLRDMKSDVRDLGLLFHGMLNEVPQISVKFSSLIKAMSRGGFAADDARRLFEALCKSLEANVFESPSRSKRLALSLRTSSLANSPSSFQHQQPQNPALQGDSNTARGRAEETKDTESELGYETDPEGSIDGDGDVGFGEDSDSDGYAKGGYTWNRGRGGTITARVSLPVPFSGTPKEVDIVLPG